MPCTVVQAEQAQLDRALPLEEYNREFTKAAAKKRRQKLEEERLRTAGSEPLSAMLHPLRGLTDGMKREAVQGKGWGGWTMVEDPR